MKVTKPGGIGILQREYYTIEDGTKLYHVYDGVIRAALTSPLGRPMTRIISAKSSPLLAARIHAAIAAA